MKSQIILTFAVSTIFAASIVTSVPSAMAAPVGSLSLSNVTGGGFTFSSTSLDFFAPLGGGFGDFATVNPTAIAYSGGLLTASTNPYGRIGDVVNGASLISNFIQFYSASQTVQPSPAGNAVLTALPAFDLVSLTAGGSAQGVLNTCAGVTSLGVSCSPFLSGGVSPIVLTQRIGYIELDLGARLVGRDSTGSSSWRGGFTTQLTAYASPDAIQTTLSNGGVILGGYSATFASDPTPEPATFGLIAIALGTGAIIRRRRIAAVAP